MSDFEKFWRRGGCERCGYPTREQYRGNLPPGWALYCGRCKLLARAEHYERLARHFRKKVAAIDRRRVTPHKIDCDLDEDCSCQGGK